MAPSKNNSHSSSNRNGEIVGRQANILASAYCVDTSARLTGFHYSTTGAGGTFFIVSYHPNRPYSHFSPYFKPSSRRRLLTRRKGPSGIPEALGIQGCPSPPSSPPLAALTSANELALISKSKRDNDTTGGRKRGARREGAAYHIRGECERLFCETLKGVFLGEEGMSSKGSIVMGMDTNKNTASLSPPDERLGTYSMNSRNGYLDTGKRQSTDAWIEVWDYAGGCSFRGFVGGDGDKKSVFAFFDAAVIGRDLKQGLMALIELAESVFAVSQVVACVNRSIDEADRKSFLKSLRWVGFELISLDLWAGDLDVTSDKWLFLGMEV